MGWRSIAVVPVLAAASLLGGAAPGGAAQTTRSVVTDAVQVTPDPSVVRAHTSPQMARNPKNGELVVVEGDIRGSRKCTVHVSVDDGRSWFEGGDPLLPPDTDCSFHADWGPYATLAFDKNGDGKLTRDEVPERMQGIFERGDTNHDGVLSAPELHAMALAQQQPVEGRGGEGRGGRGPQGMMRADPIFQALDTNHDNVISGDEITNAASALKSLDKNQDGSLSEDELRPNFGRGPGRGRG